MDTLSSELQDQRTKNIVLRRESTLTRQRADEAQQNLKLTEIQHKSELELAEQEIKAHRQRVISLQTLLKDREQSEVNFASEANLLKTELNYKLRDLKALETIVEDYSLQIKSMDFRESQVRKQEQEYK